MRVFMALVAVTAALGTVSGLASADSPLPQLAKRNTDTSLGSWGYCHYHPWICRVIRYYQRYYCRLGRWNRRCRAIRRIKRRLGCGWGWNSRSNDGVDTTGNDLDTTTLDTSDLGDIDDGDDGIDNGDDIGDDNGDVLEKRDPNTTTRHGGRWACRRYCRIIRWYRRYYCRRRRYRGVCRMLRRLERRVCWRHSGFRTSNDTLGDVDTLETTGVDDGDIGDNGDDLGDDDGLGDDGLDDDGLDDGDDGDDGDDLLVLEDDGDDMDNGEDVVDDNGE